MNGRQQPTFEEVVAEFAKRLGVPYEIRWQSSQDFVNFQLQVNQIENCITDKDWSTKTIKRTRSLEGSTGEKKFVGKGTTFVVRVYYTGFIPALSHITVWAIKKDAKAADLQTGIRKSKFR